MTSSPGAGRPAAAIGLVLGPARREELAEVVGCYGERWVIVGPGAGGQWYALPRHVTFQPCPSAAALARLLAGQASQTAARPENRPRGFHRPNAARPGGAVAAGAARTDGTG